MVLNDGAKGSLNGTRPHPPTSPRTFFWVSTPAPHLSSYVLIRIALCICLDAYKLIRRYTLIHEIDVHVMYMYLYIYKYNVLHLECHWISISNFNLLGLFSTERGTRDLENLIIDWDLRTEKWHSKCNRLHLYIYKGMYMFMSSMYTYLYMYEWIRIFVESFPCTYIMHMYIYVQMYRVFQVFIGGGYDD